MATQTYVGNDDYRGFLNYLGQNGNTAASNALNFVGNDGVWNPNATGVPFNNESINAAKSFNDRAYVDWANGNTGGYVQTDQSSYGGGAGSTAAAEKAAKVAQANAMKGGLYGVINNVKSVYDAIYGDLDTVGRDKSAAVNSRYNKENTALVDQFNTEFPAIGNAYSARGTYDSSYRQDSEAGATKQYNNMQDNLVTGRDEDLSKVGQFIGGQRAQVGADKNSLDSITALINASENPDELLQLQQTLTDKLGQVQASRAGLRSQDSYRAEADSYVSTADRTAGLKQSLGNIIAGSAPAPLKRSVAGKIIQTSGLSAGEQKAAMDEFEQLLATGTAGTVTK